MNLSSPLEPVPLVIWGASGHARVVADIVRLSGRFHIAGFIDDVNLERHGTEFCGARILGGREQLSLLHDNGIRHILLAFGNCQARLALADFVSHAGFLLETVVHPSAVVAGDVTVGAGTVVMAGAVINPGSLIGANVIINTASSVDHDCRIEDGVHIGPGAHLGGGAVIRRAAWVGMGAIIRDKITIGRDAVIGAGAVVLKDIPEGVTAFGVPARVMRRNAE